ncbi:MAG: MoxR family ATPase [Candidatus Kapaibacteriales bacterium]
MEDNIKDTSELQSPEESVSSGFSSSLDMTKLQSKVESLRKHLNSKVLGQELMVDLIIAAMLADGHILLEGVPGVAKTLTAKLFAKSIGADYSRIQFTPDLMPSDIIGTSVFDPADRKFEFKKGPVFTNILLIDEINRSPAKTQSALFEVMEERQVTVDGKTYKFQPPFLVLATQNPIEQEGTYRLPEAQLDRFLFKVIVGYPEKDQEVHILELHDGKVKSENSDSPIISYEELGEFRDIVKSVKVSTEVKSYIAGISTNSRGHRSLYLGASPRASVYLMSASKAWAAMKGRDFVTPDDVRDMAYPVLTHRMILTTEKEMDGVKVTEVVQELLDTTEVPR